MGYLWTTTEERTLRAVYPVEGPEKVASLLPGRSVSAVHAKASVLKVRAPATVGATGGMRFATKYPPDDRMDQAIRAAYARGLRERGQIKRLAEALERPKWWVCKRAVQLGCTIERVAPLPWSAPELRLLEEHAACDPWVISRKLRAAGLARTPTAVVVQLKRRQMDRTDPDAWTARDLGRLLGVDGNTVCDWVERRGLAAQRRAWGPNGRFVITRAGLRQWLREHHGYVDLRRVDQPWFWGLVLGGDAA